MGNTPYTRTPIVLSPGGTLSICYERSLEAWIEAARVFQANYANVSFLEWYFSDFIYLVCAEVWNVWNVCLKSLKCVLEFVLEMCVLKLYLYLKCVCWNCKCTWNVCVLTLHFKCMCWNCVEMCVCVCEIVSEICESKSTWHLHIEIPITPPQIPQLHTPKHIPNQNNTNKR